MAWSDNYNIIYSKEVQTNDYQYWQFRLEEHKTRGNLIMSARQFKKTDTYDRPTKNGFMIQVNTFEDVDKFKDAIVTLCEEAKSKL